MTNHLLRKALPNLESGRNCFLGSTTRALPGRWRNMVTVVTVVTVVAVVTVVTVMTVVTVFTVVTVVVMVVITMMVVMIVDVGYDCIDVADGDGVSSDNGK